MASDFEKPDKVHTLFPEEIPTKMWPLPVGELLFLGKASRRKLEEAGIHTIGDLAHEDESHIQMLLGQRTDISCISIPVGGMTLLFGQKQKKAKGLAWRPHLMRILFRRSRSFRCFWPSVTYLQPDFGKKKRNAAVLRFHSVHWILKTVLIR